MSKNYFIEIHFDVYYTEENILKILKAGFNQGFVYYDHIPGARYSDSPVLTPEEALNKIIKAANDSLSEGPAVYTKIQEDYYANFWFYNIGGFLQFHIGSFDNVKEKSFDCCSRHIDFKFYIDAAMSACQDFGIRKLIADFLL